MNDASRPIEEDEAKICEENSVEYQEMVVANDALTVVVNKENTWATCLTVDQLKMIWEPKAEGEVTNWNQVDSSFPDEEIVLFGPGTDSGTFDYFTDAINGEEGASRTDYTPSENDNNTIQGVQGSTGGMGYFGFSYYEQNADTLTAVEIDSGGRLRCTERRDCARRQLHPACPSVVHLPLRDQGRGERCARSLR